jgi:hypothetical protein
MDVLINFINSATIGGDFRTLANNTYSDGALFFYMGSGIAIFVMFMTFELLKQSEVWKFRTFYNDFGLNFLSYMNKKHE